MTDREAQLAIMKGLGAIYFALTGKPLVVDVPTEHGMIKICCEPYQAADADRPAECDQSHPTSS